MYNSTYFTSESSCSASFRDIGPWNHSSRESIWCFIEWSAPIDDIEILCTWSPILIVCWFDKFECVSIVDCTLEVTKPKTPPPGALVAKGPKKIEGYFPTIGILHTQSIWQEIDFEQYEICTILMSNGSRWLPVAAAAPCIWLREVSIWWDVECGALGLTTSPLTYSGPGWGKAPVWPRALKFQIQIW